MDEVNGFVAVFSDVVMPGISGPELGQEIRHRFRGLPVVLTSGYSHVLAEEGRHGFELIKKSYAAEELSRVLRRATVLLNMGTLAQLRRPRKVKVAVASVEADIPIHLQIRVSARNRPINPCRVGEIGLVLRDVC